MVVLSNAIAMIPILCTLLIYIGVANSPSDLTASQAFTFISLMNSAVFPMTMVSVGASKIGTALPCLIRLNKLFEQEDVDLARSHEWISHLEPGQSPLVHLEHVSYQNKTYALRDVSLEARAGEFVMLAGAVGSGKTTALLGILVQQLSLSVDYFFC